MVYRRTDKPLTPAEASRRYRERHKNEFLQEKERIRHAVRRLSLSEEDRIKIRKQTAVRVARWRAKKKALARELGSKASHQDIKPDDPSSCSSSFQNPVETPCTRSQAKASIEYTSGSSYPFAKTRTKLTPGHKRVRQENKELKERIEQLQQEKRRLRLKLSKLENDNKSSMNNNKSNCVTPVEDVNSLMKADGISPRKHPGVRRNLMLADVMLDKSSVSEEQKSKLAKLNLGRFASTRLKTYRGKFSKKAATKNDRQCEVKRKQEKVRTFMKRSDNSMCLPGKRDFVKIRKKKVQKHVLTEYLHNLHAKYNAENGSKLSYSSFCKWRPDEVKTVAYAERLTCLCIKHTNYALKLKSLLKALGRSTVCKPNEFIEKNSNEQIKEMIGGLENGMIKIEEWRRVEKEDGLKRTCLVPEEITKEDFQDKFLAEGIIFKEHQRRVIAQYENVQILKSHLTSESITLQMDFSENFASAVSEEIQSFYFSKSSVSLHPAVMHYQDLSANKLMCLSYIAVIDDQAHAAYTVFAVLRKLIPLIKTAIPKLHKIHYLTDSTSAQYRNVSITSLLLKHEALFQVRADWLFFESGHGKGPCDGVGGVSKRRAEEALKRGQVVTLDSATKYYNWAKSDTSSSIQYFLVTKEDVARARDEMLLWQAVRVPRIMSCHSIMVHGPALYTRETSCYKECCYDHESKTFIGGCDGWTKTMATRAKFLNDSGRTLGYRGRGSHGHGCGRGRGRGCGRRQCPSIT